MNTFERDGGDNEYFEPILPSTVEKMHLIAKGPLKTKTRSKPRLTQRYSESNVYIHK